MAGRTKGGFSPECSPGAAPPGNGISGDSPEALLRGYTRGDFPAGSSLENSPCSSLNRIEQRLQGCPASSALPGGAAPGLQTGTISPPGPPRNGSFPSHLHCFVFFEPS